MTRTFIMVWFAFSFYSHLVAQSQVFVGRLVNTSKHPSEPVGKATVTLLNTSQDAITDGNGRFQFALPPGLVAGSEVQIAVKAGSLRVYLPPNGVLNIPAQGVRPLEVQVLPAGSKLFSSLLLLKLSSRRRPNRH